LDILDCGSDTVGVLLGNGNGTFKSPANISFATTYVAGFAVADINNDGKLDLIAPQTQNPQVYELLGNGDGTFAAPLSTVVSDGPYDPVMGDFNGDGHPDLLVATYPSSVVMPLLNTAWVGSSTFSVAPLPATHFALSVPVSATAGNGFSITVKAQDSLNQTVTAYSGTVHFASSDALASLPANATLVGGVGVFSVTLKTAGLQTISSQDIVAGTIAGTSTAITVFGGAATHLALAAPASAIAGTPIPLTVTALDLFGNRALGYAGTIHFASSDSLAVLPPNSTVSNGIGIFSATLKSAGGQMVTVSDVLVGGLSPATATVTVNPAAAARFALVVPSAFQPGSAFAFTVMALDTFGNAASTYTGSVRFTTSDPQGMLPSPSTLAAGVGVFSAMFFAHSSQTLTAADTVNNSISGSAVVSVSPMLSIPTNLKGGRGSVVTVPINISTLFDASAGLSGLGSGTLVLLFNPALFAVTSADIQIGSLLKASTGWNVMPNIQPGQMILGVQSDGIHLLTATSGGTLVTVNFHVTSNALLGPTRIDLAADLSGGAPLTGISDQNFGAYSLGPPPQDNAILSPTFAYSGSDPCDGTVTITGVNLPPTAGNDAYSITARVATTDSGLTMSAPGLLGNDTDPQSYALQALPLTNPAHGTVTINADGSFVYLSTPGYVGPDSFTYMASDGFSSSSPATVNLNVTPRLSIPTTLLGSPGRSVVVPVMIDNPDPAGSGGLAAAVLAIDYDPAVFTVSNSDIQQGTLTGGWNLIANTNQTTGEIAIVVGNNTPLTGTAPGSLVILTMHINASAPLGASALNLAATNAPSGHTVTTGLDALNGPLALRPALTNAANDPYVDGLVTVLLAPTLVVNTLTPTSTGFVAVFNKPVDPTTLNLYDASIAAYGPADVSVVGKSGAAQRGSLLLDPTNTTITFVKTGNGSDGLLLPDTYTVTFRSAVNGFKDMSGQLLDGNGDDIPGDNFTGVFTVAAPTGAVLSVPSFARGPDGVDDILLPARVGTGIPITLTGAQAVTDIAFDLDYDPSLLNVSGAANGPAGTFSLVSASGGVASFLFHSATPLSGSVTLGQIMAQVPNSAASDYKAKQLLHLTNIVVNGSSTALGKDGIQVVAYLGDASGDGTVSGIDASLLSRVGILMDSGFAAYRLLDPSIVGDVGGNGSVDGSDVTLINRFLAGLPTPQVPVLPPGLTIVPTGPDPALSIPDQGIPTPGADLLVPVNIDTAMPEGSTGTVDATLALRYDPRFFSLTESDIKLGELAGSCSDWQLAATINPVTGEIGVNLFGASPITSTAGGTLVTIDLHVLASAPLGATAIALVPEVSPGGLRVYRTSVADSQGALQLHMANATFVVTGATPPIAEWPGLQPGNKAPALPVDRSDAVSINLIARENASYWSCVFDEAIAINPAQTVAEVMPLAAPTQADAKPWTASMLLEEQSRPGDSQDPSDVDGEDSLELDGFGRASI
jgi:hypothetical protein